MPTASSQIASFIARFDPANAKLIRACRSALRKRLPSANELVYDNYNFLAIGYSASERPSDCVFSLACGSNGVSLSFYYGATLPNPDGILLGSGNQNRFVRLPTVATLADPKVERLMRAALAQAKTPMPSTGRGRTIVKSISAKQRPRRAVER
jgi:hypothetical protein